MERTSLNLVMATANLASDMESSDPPELPSEPCVIIAGPTEAIRKVARLFGEALVVRAADPKPENLILGSKDHEALFARCARCSTIWPMVRLPAEISEIRAAAKLRCPYCDCDKAFLTAHPLESVKGVGAELVPKFVPDWDNPDGPGAA